MLNKPLDITVRDDLIDLTIRNLPGIGQLVYIEIRLDWKDVFRIWEEALTGNNNGNVKIRMKKQIPYEVIVNARNNEIKV